MPATTGGSFDSLLSSKIAISLNAFFIALPLSTVGMLFFVGFFKMCTMSLTACLIAYTGIVVSFGINCNVSVSTSLKVSGL